MVLDWIVVDFLILRRQPVCSVIFAELNSGLFCSSHGLFTSTETSPVAVSKKVPPISASFGIAFEIIDLASSSFFLMDSSVLTTILFLITFTKSDTIWLFSIRNDGDFVYSAILGPS